MSKELQILLSEEQYEYAINGEYEISILPCEKIPHGTALILDVSDPRDEKTLRNLIS